MQGKLMGNSGPGPAVSWWSDDRPEDLQTKLFHDYINQVFQRKGDVWHWFHQKKKMQCSISLIPGLDRINSALTEVPKHQDAWM